LSGYNHHCHRHTRQYPDENIATFRKHGVLLVGGAYT
jgi:hypothetical protein